MHAVVKNYSKRNIKVVRLFVLCLRLITKLTTAFFSLIDMNNGDVYSKFLD